MPKQFDLTYSPQPFNTETPIDVIPDELKKEYGSGLAFPLNYGYHGWRNNIGESKISQSVYVILTTPIGTRFGRPDFGSMLPLLVFSSIDDVLLQEIDFYTRDALSKWEPRITVEDVKVDSSQQERNLVAIHIFYTIKGVGVSNEVRLVADLYQGNLAFQPIQRFTQRGQSIPVGNVT